MSHKTQPMGRIYEIRLQGHLDTRRVGSFDGLTATWLPCGETVLTGPVADQAALFGILDRIRDMGIALLAVCCLDSERERGETHL